MHERNLKLLASKLSFIEYARCYAWEFVLHYWKASTETMTTMIGINRKFFRETIGYGRCISNLTTIEGGEWHKKFGKNMWWWSSRSRVLIFSLLRSRLWCCVQGFSKQQSFHGKAEASMILQLASFFACWSVPISRILYLYIRIVVQHWTVARIESRSLLRT